MKKVSALLFVVAIFATNFTFAHERVKVKKIQAEQAAQPFEVLHDLQKRCSVSKPGFTFFWADHGPAYREVKIYAYTKNQQEQLVLVPGYPKTIYSDRNGHIEFYLLQTDFSVVMYVKTVWKNDQTYWSETITDCIKALPLTLNSFDGERIEETIVLNWKTSDEKDFDYFELEKSLNAKEFSSIKTIKSGKNVYSIPDDNPNEGTNYYRLKMVDIDGKLNYSKVIAVDFERGGSYVSVENPASNGQINVLTNLENPNFVLLNPMGQAVDISSFKIDHNKFSISVKNAQPGIYFLQIGSVKERKVKKLLLVN